MRPYHILSLDALGLCFLLLYRMIQDSVSRQEQTVPLVEFCTSMFLDVIMLCACSHASVIDAMSRLEKVSCTARSTDSHAGSFCCIVAAVAPQWLGTGEVILGSKGGAGAPKIDLAAGGTSSNAQAMFVLVDGRPCCGTW